MLAKGGLSRIPGYYVPPLGHGHIDKSQKEKIDQIGFLGIHQEREEQKEADDRQTAKKGGPPIVNALLSHWCSSTLLGKAPKYPLGPKHKDQEKCAIGNSIRPPATDNVRTHAFNNP